MIDNYVPYHVHSDYSSGVTNIDSTNKPAQFIARAKECGMKAFGFSEHGNVYSWLNKKLAIEQAEMKYIHAQEFYVTETIPFEDGKPKPIRENLHCVLIARNHEGFKELNTLSSAAFNREDGHFYYYPRITFDELQGTSENIMVTTACLGGIFAKAQGELKDKVKQFLLQNKRRCFLEVQHHFVLDQIYLNRELVELNHRYGIPLIAGTDTHCLDDFSAECRKMLQIGKGVSFSDESEWDLRFKTLDELIEAYKRQGALNELDYMSAIDDTNMMADMVQPFELDLTPKYPAFSDNPDAEFEAEVWKCVNNHPYLTKNHPYDEIRARIEYELDSFRKTKSTTYMLLYRSKIVEWEHASDIFAGYGRGSVAGSLVAYALGITEVDPLKYGLSFERFCNPDRVSQMDIDADIFAEDRERLLEHILKDKLDIPHAQSCRIITYQQEGMRGAIKDIGRALKMSPAETDRIAKQEHEGDVPPETREQYPELFRYVDGIIGVVTALGQHAAGAVICDDSDDLSSNMGLCSSSHTPYVISQLNMDEISYLQYVKYDCLGLRNVGLINKTCKLAGIDRLTPDNCNMEDMDVWRSIRDDTTLIFQWSGNQATAYIKQFMSDPIIEEARERNPHFSMLMWMAFGNGLLRPGAASFRDLVKEGLYKTYPIPEMNECLASDAGYVCMQETIMRWLVQFCGYTGAQSDTVRRAIAHKGSAETFAKLTAEIRENFLKYTPAHYNVSIETAQQIIDPFIQTIIDASSYAFSWNHAVPYSAIGYICGYLRYYYPLEFIATAIDIFADMPEQISEIMAYAARKHIPIVPARYGKSRSFSSVDKAEGKIYQNLCPVKNVSAVSAEELYSVSQQLDTQYFVDVLDAVRGTNVRANMLTSLIDIDFFETFGNATELTRILELYTAWRDKKKFKPEDIDTLRLVNPESFATNRNGKGKELKAWTITDRTAFLHAIEDGVKSIGLPDYCLKAKLEKQMEILGHISIRTEADDDRYKLYITELRPLKRKTDGKVWGYGVQALSIGTGATQQLTLNASAYDIRPFVKGDIIKTTYPGGLYKNKKGYWCMADYEYAAM